MDEISWRCKNGTPGTRNKYRSWYFSPYLTLVKHAVCKQRILCLFCTRFCLGSQQQADRQWDKYQLISYFAKKKCTVLENTTLCICRFFKLNFLDHSFQCEMPAFLVFFVTDVDCACCTRTRSTDTQDLLTCCKLKTSGNSQAFVIHLTELTYIESDVLAAYCLTLALWVFVTCLHNTHTCTEYSYCHFLQLLNTAPGQKGKYNWICCWNC